MPALVHPFEFIRAHLNAFGSMLFVGALIYLGLQIVLWETVGKRLKESGHRLPPAWLGGGWRSLATIYGEKSMAHAGPVTRPLLRFARWYCVLFVGLFITVVIAFISGEFEPGVFDLGPTTLEQAQQRP